jgi:3-dehydroquinate synthase
LRRSAADEVYNNLLPVNHPANIMIESLTYPVYLGHDLWQEIDQIARPFLKSGGVYILTDTNTSRFCFPTLSGKIPILTGQALYSITPGEQSKDLQGLAGVWKWLMESGAGRNSLLINLGGGVVSDMGGFAAATFNRGMKYINIPTSLIGQVDAAIGGKSALNVSGIKNQVGLFYNPEAVFILPDFLETLPEAHFKSGFAEIIKCAALSGGEFWERLKKANPTDRKNIFNLLSETVRFKCRVVAEDQFDNSARKMLNFGHTVGHALESIFNIKDENFILHGEAVAAGMICEAYLSNKLAGMGIDELEEISSVIRNYFDLKPIGENHFERLAEFVNYDKKKSANGIGFSLLEGFGKHSPGIVVNSTDLIQSIAYYNGILRQW